MEKIKKICDWINQYADNNNFKSLVIGISGGIDSALVSTLCAMTGKNVIVVSLPIKQNQDELSRARNHINWLKNKFQNVSSLEINLTESYYNFISNFNFDQSNLSKANTKSRLRMVSLYHVASNTGSLVVGTGNKIEDFGIGFFTKYGDGGVDISPIADLLKSEVFSLALSLGINSDILNAEPTDGLWEDGRTDFDQLKISYDDLEWAMSYTGDTSVLSKEKLMILERYKLLNKMTQHKINPIPICKLN